MVARSATIFCDYTATFACLHHLEKYLLLAANHRDEVVSPVGRDSPGLLSSPVHHGDVHPCSYHAGSFHSGDRFRILSSSGLVVHLLHGWPSMIDLFATSLTARLPVYFSKMPSSLSVGPLSSDNRHEVHLCRPEVVHVCEFSLGSILTSVGNCPRTSSDYRTTRLSYYAREEFV